MPDNAEQALLGIYQALQITQLYRCQCGEPFGSMYYFSACIFVYTLQLEIVDNQINKPDALDVVVLLAVQIITWYVLLLVRFGYYFPCVC